MVILKKKKLGKKGKKRIKSQNQNQDFTVKKLKQATNKHNILI